jgi:prepilin-type N-terminal cleavage/methylation domain-containing protein/prepilin-type processing-associated H-X9-DG protein
MSRRSGFTLIELLVVIAVIAILAAILLPVFARAREQAHKIVCLSNVKQIGTAMHLYAQDYDETLPGWDYVSGHPLSPVWDTAIIVPLLRSYTQSDGLWTCPSAPRHPLFLRGPVDQPVYVHYCYNAYLYETRPLSVPVTPGHWNRLAALAGTQAGIANIAMLADCSRPAIFNDWGNLLGLDIPGTPPGFGIPQLMYANGYDWDESGQGRHEPAGASVVFVDGHARFIQSARMRGSYGTKRRADIGGFIEFPVVNPLNLPPS